jgi:hypothetical protein
MDEFDALISSLGESIVAYVGRDNLRRLDVFGDEDDSTARVEICLEDNSWGQQSHAIDKMIELRAMFLDELSLEYRFVEEDRSTASSAHARHSQFSLA